MIKHPTKIYLRSSKRLWVIAIKKQKLNKTFAPVPSCYLFVIYKKYHSNKFCVFSHEVLPSVLLGLELSGINVTLASQFCESSMLLWPAMLWQLITGDYRLRCWSCSRMSNTCTKFSENQTNDSKLNVYIMAVSKSYFFTLCEEKWAKMKAIKFTSVTWKCN
jgi:hypothetical protein